MSKFLRSVNVDITTNYKEKIKQLDEQIKNLQESRNAIAEELSRQCQHPIYTRSEKANTDEWGTTQSHTVTRTCCICGYSESGES